MYLKYIHIYIYFNRFPIARLDDSEAVGARKLFLTRSKVGENWGLIGIYLNNLSMSFKNDIFTIHTAMIHVQTIIYTYIYIYFTTYINQNGYNF